MMMMMSWLLPIMKSNGGRVLTLFELFFHIIVKEHVVHENFLDHLSNKGRPRFLEQIQLLQYFNARVDNPPKRLPSSPVIHIHILLIDTKGSLLPSF